MSLFIVGFYVLLVLCAVLFFFTRSTVQYAKDAQFSRFQRVYLVVYLLAVGTQPKWIAFDCSIYYLYQTSGKRVYYLLDLQLLNFKNFELRKLIYDVLIFRTAAGDWLQGPYVYALYQSYGMTSHDIEILFVAGFGSSLLFGTVVGSVADKQ